MAAALAAAPPDAARDHFWLVERQASTEVGTGTIQSTPGSGGRGPQLKLQTLCKLLEPPQTCPIEDDIGCQRWDCKIVIFAKWDVTVSSEVYMGPHWRCWPPAVLCA
jgi:hypothetical protein